MIIDKKTGKTAPGIDKILQKAEEKSPLKEHTIVHEIAEEMIEVGSYPNVEGSNTMKSLLENVKLIAYAADEVGLAILPLGAYPGKFTPTLRSSPKYDLLRKLFGKTKLQTWGRFTGYHCHYALPWGVFDSKKMELKDFSDSKNQENLVSAYNFLIALDPVLTTFMQSTPFYQGRFVAKDSRTVLYRGDIDMGAKDSPIIDHKILGVLPPYVHTGTDIKHLAERRKSEWVAWCAEKGISEKDAIGNFRSIYGINWSPVRVNDHNTFEQRGMDMNRLPVLLSVSVLIQTIMKFIQDGELKVVPHDLAKAEPFKLDEKEKIIYISPDTHVRKTLQRLAAYEGLENDDVFHYCKRVVSLAKLLGGEKVEELLKPLSTMLSERMTTSDKILAQAKSLGYKDFRKSLPQSIASEIALSHAKQMFEDMVILEKMIESNNSLQS